MVWLGVYREWHIVHVYSKAIDGYYFLNLIAVVMYKCCQLLDIITYNGELWYNHEPVNRCHTICCWTCRSPALSKSGKRRAALRNCRVLFCSDSSVLPILTRCNDPCSPFAARSASALEGRSNHHVTRSLHGKVGAIAPRDLVALPGPGELPRFASELGFWSPPAIALQIRIFRHTTSPTTEATPSM